MSDTEQAVEQQQSAPPDQSKPQVQNVDFPEAAQTASSGAGGSIDILLDMAVPVTVVIGQTQMPVKQLLQLGPGSVVELDRSVNAPADLYLRDSKFATGTIVVVEDQFAVRINEILGLGQVQTNTESQQAAANN